MHTQKNIQPLLFSSLDLSENGKQMPHHKNSMNPPFEAIFKMAANKYENTYNSASRTHRDMILVSIPRFWGMWNPIGPPKSRLEDQPS